MQKTLCNSSSPLLVLVGATGPPPEDFRQLRVFPTAEDILTRQAPFLRQNLLDEGYVDKEHYLDVWVRLLREDYIKPIREGVRTYHGLQTNRKTNYRLQARQKSPKFTHLLCIQKS